MLFVTTIQHKWVLLCLDPQPELRAVGASYELTLSVRSPPVGLHRACHVLMSA